jgi:excinuclease ABC subunit A
MTLAASSPDEIRIENARSHNLRGVSCRIPIARLSVVTGVSGSGKSTLAFDTLYAEGQRRYVTSLSAYARQFLERLPRPEVDFISNLPPAIAIEQRNTVTNARSTVGTATEILDHLRLPYAKDGETRCCWRPAASRPSPRGSSIASREAGSPSRRESLALAASGPPGSSSGWPARATPVCCGPTDPFWI